MIVTCLFVDWDQTVYAMTSLYSASLFRVMHIVGCNIVKGFIKRGGLTVHDAKSNYFCLSIVLSAAGLVWPKVKTRDGPPVAPSQEITSRIDHPFASN